MPIGSPGNPGDATGSPFMGGAVDYRYRIGKYEISEQMIDKANALGGLGITKDSRGPDKPATSISWFEAAQFVNWLNADAGFPVAYKFVGNDFQLWDPNDPGYNPNNLYRNKLAKYVLPSAHEWYKAAYYNPNAGNYFHYPTGTNSIPDGIDSPGDPIFDAVFFDGSTSPGPNDITNVGILSPYGTAGQGGNVSEWEETSADLLNDAPGSGRGDRGGSWNSGVSLLVASNRNAITPTFEGNFMGLRIVSVPEPNGAFLFTVGFVLRLALSRRMKS